MAAIGRATYLTARKSTLPQRPPHVRIRCAHGAAYRHTERQASRVLQASTLKAWASDARSVSLTPATQPWNEGEKTARNTTIENYLPSRGDRYARTFSLSDATAKELHETAATTRCSGSSQAGGCIAMHRCLQLCPGTFLAAAGVMAFQKMALRLCSPGRASRPRASIAFIGSSLPFTNMLCYVIDKHNPQLLVRVLARH